MKPVSVNIQLRKHRAMTNGIRPEYFIDDYSSMNRIDNELDFAVGRTFAAADMNHVAHRELARLGYVMVDIKCNIQYETNCNIH
jgi:hypothetical protein